MTEQEKAIGYISHHLHNALAIGQGCVSLINIYCDCPDLQIQVNQLKKYSGYLVRATRYMDKKEMQWEDIKLNLKNILARFKTEVESCLNKIESLLCQKAKDRMEVLRKAYKRIVDCIEGLDEVDINNWKYP